MWYITSGDIITAPQSLSNQNIVLYQIDDKLGIMFLNNAIIHFNQFKFLIRHHRISFDMQDVVLISFSELAIYTQFLIHNHFLPDSIGYPHIQQERSQTLNGF